MNKVLFLLFLLIPGSIGGWFFDDNVYAIIGGAIGVVIITCLFGGVIWWNFLWYGIAVALMTLTNYCFRQKSIHTVATKGHPHG